MIDFIEIQGCYPYRERTVFNKTKLYLYLRNHLFVRFVRVHGVEVFLRQVGNDLVEIPFVQINTMLQRHLEKNYEEIDFNQKISKADFIEDVYRKPLVENTNRLRGILGTDVQLSDNFREFLMDKYQCFDKMEDKALLFTPRKLTPAAIRAEELRLAKRLEAEGRKREREKLKQKSVLEKQEKALQKMELTKKQTALKKAEKEKIALERKQQKMEKILQLKARKKAYMEVQKQNTKHRLSEVQRQRKELAERERLARRIARVSTRQSRELTEKTRMNEVMSAEQEIKLYRIEKLSKLIEQGFNCPLSADIKQFFYLNQFVRARDFIGNFNRGADIYYREVALGLFLVFSNNHFSTDEDQEQFALWVVESDIDTYFFYTMLRIPPRCVTRRFTLPADALLPEIELRKIRQKIKL